MECISQILFIHLTTDGHLVCLHVLAVLNTTATNVKVRISMGKFSIAEFSMFSKMNLTQLLLGAQLCFLKIHMLKYQPPVLQNVTSFGGRVLKEVIKVK